MEQSTVADDGQEAAAPLRNWLPSLKQRPWSPVSPWSSLRCSQCLLWLRQPTKDCDFQRRWLGCGSLDFSGKTHETTDGRYQRGRLMGYPLRPILDVISERS